MYLVFYIILFTNVMFLLWYRCTHKSCKGMVSVDKSEQIVLKKTDHNHLSKDNLDVKRLQNCVKRKALDDISERPSKIINTAIRQETSDFNITTSDLKNIRKSIYRARRSILPPLPRTIQDVHRALDFSMCKTNKDEDFLLINNHDLNIVLFSCFTNLKYLCTRDKIFIDGTFQYCPKFFTQLFTIHTVENGNYIPLVFILLRDKQSKTYVHCFKILCDYINSVNLVFTPKEVVCDFEQSIHIAVRTVWPDVNIIGCRFHLTQSWFRQIQKLGLVKEFRDTYSEIGRWLKWTFGLLFLNPNEVENSFVDDLYSVMPSNEKCVKYADYLVDNYICEVATFTPDMWASCTQSLERTTNGCESFHSKFNESFYMSHPDIFKFIDVIKDVQLNTYIKIVSVHLDHSFKKNKYKKKHDYVANLINLYKTKQISRFDFVKTVCQQYVQ